MYKKYKRYTSRFQNSRENSEERRRFEAEVIQGFLQILTDKKKLNVKVDRELFDELLNDVGYSLQKFARKVIANPTEYSELNKILNSNPIPQIADDIMTKEFRIFCLSLNALKQFISAEQAATDRFLLGGDYKKKIKKVIDSCIVSGLPLNYEKRGQVNFHHTMRDGRFPIPLTKNSHDMIEGQLKPIYTQTKS